MKISTICFDCKKAGYGKKSECPWERNFTPVPGWDATRTVSKNGGKETESYVVRACPLFEDEGKKSFFRIPLFPARTDKPTLPRADPKEIEQIHQEIEREIEPFSGRERQTQRKKAIKRHGLCVICGCEFSTPEMATCAKCRIYHSQLRIKRKEQKHDT